MSIKEEQDGQKAFDLNSSIIDAEQTRRFLLQRNIEALDQLESTGLYKVVLGDPNAPWKAYLGQLDVFYTRAEIHNYLRIYRRLTKELGIDAGRYLDIPRSRLVDLLPFIDSVTPELWFDQARTLISKDWKIEVRKAKGLITEEDDHEHKMVAYEECSICGLKTKHTHEIK